MSGNDFLGAFYEKPQKPYGFSWLEGVQTGQEPENPAACASTPTDPRPARPKLSLAWTQRGRGQAWQGPSFAWARQGPNLAEAKLGRAWQVPHLELSLAGAEPGAEPVA